MIPSLEGWPTKAKEAPSPHEVRLAPLDTNLVFQSLRGKSRGGFKTKSKPSRSGSVALRQLNPTQKRAMKFFFKRSFFADTKI